MSNIYLKVTTEKNWLHISQNPLWLFYYFNFERNCGVLKSKSPGILLNKNINFNKNETESKMENLLHSFRETNLLLHLIQESQIKSKTFISFLNFDKHFFCTVYFVRKNFFQHLRFISMYSVLNTLAVHT